MRKVSVGFLTLVVSFFSLLLIASLIPRKWGKDLYSTCECQICVTNSGLHTDILLPRQNHIFDWQNYFTKQEIGTNTPTPYKYLSFGWGDRNFFMNSPTRIELVVSKGFKALFLPTPSVMRVQGHFSIPQNKEVKCVGVSRSDYLKVVEFIQDSFQLHDRGRKILISYNRHPQTSFYEAKGTYSVLRTSNSWTASGLRNANVSTPLWAGLSYPIMFHLNRVCRP